MVHEALQAQGSNFTFPFFVLFHCFIVALCAVSLLNMLGPHTSEHQITYCLDALLQFSGNETEARYLLFFE